MARFLIALFGVVALAGCEAHEFSSGSAEAMARTLGVALSPRRDVPKSVVDAAKPIGREVVCLCGTCPRRLVTECDCGWAKRNQAAIQYALMDGHTPEAIVAAFIEAHGEKARPVPPDDALGQASWALPVVITLATLLVLAWFGARLRPRTPVPVRIESEPDPAREAARRQLERELEDLED